MKRLLSVTLLTLFLFTTTAFAATPLKTVLEIKEGRHLIVKTFDGSADENPSLLEEKPFELDGFSYTYFSTDKEEVPLVESKQETQDVSISTADNDSVAILQQLVSEMDYSIDGFTGKLMLDHTSIKTEVEGYVAKSYTLSDTRTYPGLSSNDPVNIPKTAVRSGVDMKLQSIDWSIKQTDAIDFETIPLVYTAVVTYSGSYSKNIPTGYVTTAKYSGEVTKKTIEKVIYTLSYLGEKLPEPTPVPTPVPTPTAEIELPIEATEKAQTSFILWIAGLIISLLLIGGGVAAFWFFHNNVHAYLKKDEEYQLIARRYIKWSNPIVDLSSIELSGKEVAIYVKKQTARKLFGRHIKTVVGDFSTLCLVDKQDSDFWYAISVPEMVNDSAEPMLSPEKTESETDEKAAPKV